MYACHLMKNSAFKLRKKFCSADAKQHHDTDVRILFKSVKVQYSTEAQFVRKHNIMCQRPKICCWILVIGRDKI